MKQNSREDLHIATASASELATLARPGTPLDTPIEDKPVPIKMPRSFSLDDEDQSQPTQRIAIIVSVLFLVYAVVMSTYAVIATGTADQSCKCSRQDVESAFTTETGPGTGISDSRFCDIVGSCIDIEATDSPTANPSKYPSVTASDSPSLNPTRRPSSAPTAEPTLVPTTEPTSEPTTEPTMEPTMEPTIEPTTEPTLEPTIATTEPSASPTTEPTNEPTMEPTSEPTLPPSAPPTVSDEYYIGDFKLSLQSHNHGYWALCDGSVLPMDGAYGLLFDVVGFSFGAYNDSNGTMHFRLPNATDSVLGIGGKGHPIGEQIGEEGVQLASNQIPAHRHPVVNYGASGDGTSSYSDKGLCNYYHSSWGYHLRVCNGLPNTYSTGYPWEGYGTNPVSVMQPTSFISNLFIYAGVQT